MPTPRELLLRRCANLFDQQHLAVREHAANRVALGFVAGLRMACDIAAADKRRAFGRDIEHHEFLRRAEMQVDANAIAAGDGNAKA